MAKTENPKTLGLFVRAEENLAHLPGLTAAARRAGARVIIFASGPGVVLAAQPWFEEVAGMAETSLCRVSLGKYLPGLNPEHLAGRVRLANQTAHAGLILACDRYLVL